MSALFGFDAFSPAEIAERVDTVGVAKARLPLIAMLMLSLLAGAFIGLGTLYFVPVRSDPGLGFAAKQVVGGVTFSLGLMLVIVAGAELFTGNNLLIMAWADGRISSYELLRNWFIVCIGGFRVFVKAGWPSPERTQGAGRSQSPGRVAFAYPFT